MENIVIKKQFRKAPFIDNPYKDIYYIDFINNVIFVYKKIENNSFFKFLDKDRDNKYELIGSEKFYSEASNELELIDKLKKQIFDYNRDLKYFELSNLNFLNNIINKLNENDILSKEKFLKDLYLLDLDLEKLSILMQEKCNVVGFSQKLEHDKEMKIAHVTGSLSGIFMAKELFMLKTPIKDLICVIDNIIESK